MRFLTTHVAACLSLLLLQAQQTLAKAVFAHYLVSVPAVPINITSWTSDFLLAQSVGIDGFALNMASSDPNNAVSLTNAFAAAAQTGFKLFFSFDYQATGAWDQNLVIQYLQKWGSHPAYFQHEGTARPLASTFEGGSSSNDWYNIKRQTNCFLLPEWDGSGGPYYNQGSQVADGYFSWTAWPDGPSDMSVSMDSAYMAPGKPYMMPVSPWFYTNLPNWGKNWLWRGDNLWTTRWQQVMQLNPQYVEILSWNDFGESNYIGPLDPRAYGLFGSGGAPMNYVDGMPHDGWRALLPFYIQWFKTGVQPVVQSGNEVLSGWYRPNPGNACGSGGTRGNAPWQNWYSPGSLERDAVSVAAMLGGNADLVVTIGDVASKGTWTNVPQGGKGVYFGTVDFGGRTGQVVVEIVRGGQTVMRMVGREVTGQCVNGVVNWNAWVGTGTSQSVAATASLLPTTSSSASWSASPTFVTSTITSTAIKSTSTTSTSTSTSALTSTSTSSTRTSPATTPLPSVVYCTAGTGDPFGLCAYTCQYGYCPSDICTCTSTSTTKPTPPSPNLTYGYPILGVGCGYLGLCSWSCYYGLCPGNVCTAARVTPLC